MIRIIRSLRGQLIFFMLLSVLLGCSTLESMRRVYTADFVFIPPQGFSNMQIPDKTSIVMLYGDDDTNSFAILHFYDLTGSELTGKVCNQFVDAFRISEYRNMIHGSDPRNQEFVQGSKVRTCYFNYEMIDPENTIHQVGIKLFQRLEHDPFYITYAIIISYEEDLKIKERLISSMNSFQFINE